jgi:hypothetical protein
MTASNRNSTSVTAGLKIVTQNRNSKPELKTVTQNRDDGFLLPLLSTTLAL